MSVQAMTWAFDQELPCAHKFVLVALCDAVDSDGKCWPSQATLARKCGLSRQYVNKVLADLERDGWIAIEGRKTKTGGDASCRYSVARFTPELADEVSTELTGGVPTETTPPVNVGDTHYIEPKKEPKRNPLKSPKGDGGFEDFWQVYPKKVGKQDALKAWPKALKADNPQIIIEGARRYASDHTADWDYWKNPSGWLNGKRWLDQPLTNGALLNGYSGPSQPLTDAQREEIIRRTHGS